MKVGSSSGPSRQQEASRKTEPQRDSEQSVHMLDSPVAWKEEPEKLWQAPPMLVPSQKVHKPASSPKPKVKPTFWQPTPAPTPPASESASEQEPEPKPIESQPAPTMAEDSARAQDEQISEISKCLMELQHQNAIMMQALVAVTNIKSNQQDMALLAKKFDKGASVVRNERVKSSLIDH